MRYIFALDYSHFKAQGKKWNAFAYEKAIRAIEVHPEKIERIEQTDKIQGIGVKIKKIVEIYILFSPHLPQVQDILRGTLVRVELENSDEKTITLKRFNDIWGTRLLSTSNLISRFWTKRFFEYV